MRQEILHYNVFAVANIMREPSHLLIPFISDDYSEELVDKYDKFGLNNHNAVYDRTGHLPHFLNMSKDLHPMPKFQQNYSTSFFEITERRCKELLSLNKPIYVMWSGGIDSTYILFCLRHFANDKDQVRVYGTYNSLIESGDLFDRRIKNDFIFNINVANTNKFKYNEDAIYVSGMGGNQLFGPTDNMFATGGTAMFHHTLGTPDTIYESYEKHIDPELIEFFDPMIKNSPKKIETVADLRWYCIFNMDWYTGIYEHKILLDKPSSDKIYAFFDSEEFQIWSISTNEPFTKVKGDPNTHRWQMRQVLDELFDEPHYAKFKDKKISNFGIGDPNWVFLLKDNHTVMYG